MSKRNEIVDIIRGIGICLIVLGHTKFIGTNYVYLFHVAVFIIASGMFYNGKKIITVRELGNFIKKKIKSLYVPYVIINLSFLLLNNFFININIYSTDTHHYYNIIEYGINFIKIILFRGTTELGGATWFLHLLFLISVVYSLVTYILNKIFAECEKNVKISQFIISIIMLIIGYMISTLGYKEMFSIYIITLNCYWLFFFGNIFNSFKDKLKMNNNVIVYIIILSSLLFLLNSFGSIEISKNIYTFPLFFIIVSISGWLLLYFIAILAEKKLIGKLLSYIGKNSLYILVFHFVGFKLVNMIIFYFIEHDVNILSSFPVVYGGIYSVIYFICGILISLLLYRVKNDIKKVMIKIRRHSE